MCSRPLSLSFLVRKKKGEEKRKTTEDHPKTVQRGGSNPRERDQISNVLIFLQEDVKEDSLRESKRGYTHLLIPLRVFATVWNDFKSDTTTQERVKKDDDDDGSKRLFSSFAESSSVSRSSSSSVFDDKNERKEESEEKHVDKNESKKKFGDENRFDARVYAFRRKERVLQQQHERKKIV